MIELEKLCDVAARRMAPHDLEEGHRQTERLIRPLRYMMIAFNFSCSFISAIGLILTIYSAAFIYIYSREPVVYHFVALPAVGAIFCLGGFIISRKFQARRRFLTSRPYDCWLPIQIEQLLEELKTGQLLTAMRVLDGPKGGDAWQAADNQFYDHGLSPTTFSNRYAAILLSTNPNHYRTVSMPKAQKMGRSIYVYRKPTEQREDEPLSDNYDPRDQWLVGGSQAQFRVGLSEFLKTVKPDKNDWEETVLVTGRRALRKGVSQADAIREIIEALKAKKLPYPDVERGDSISTIKQRLQGKRGMAGIKGYFAPSEPRDSLN